MRALAVVVGAMVIVGACSSDRPDATPAENEASGVVVSSAGGPLTAEPSPADAGPSTTSVDRGVEGLPDPIWCRTQYRPNANTLEGAEEPTLEVRRSDALAGTRETLTFPTMELAVTYFGDVPEGASVVVAVRANDGDELVHTLYQLGSVPLADVDVAGGHGFTGLQYVTHGPAQLQVWCSTA